VQPILHLKEVQQANVALWNLQPIRTGERGWNLDASGSHFGADGSARWFSFSSCWLARGLQVHIPCSPMKR